MSGMASDRSDDIDHLDFETPSDLERQLTASAAAPVPRPEPQAAPERYEDDDDGPTRLPGHHLRRAVIILVALLLLVALFLSSGVMGLFRPVQPPTDGGDRGVNAQVAPDAALVGAAG